MYFYSETSPIFLILKNIDCIILISKFLRFEQERQDMCCVYKLQRCETETGTAEPAPTVPHA